LTAPVRALRVHVNAGVGAVSAENIHLAAGAASRGRWYAIGDFIQPYNEFIASRALPKTPSRHGNVSFFTNAVIVDLLPESILNVGIAAGLFGHRGGGEQAEFLDGPAPREVSSTDSVWSRRYGRA